MYDIHTHILPGIDDGPVSKTESLEMARISANQGTRIILATPHRKDVTEKHSVSRVRNVLEMLNKELSDLQLDIELKLGMENHLSLDLPEDFSSGIALSMNNSRYILVEAPFFGQPNYMSTTLFQLQLQDLVPVLAHPERIEAFQANPALLSEYIERGMLSQITAGSILGLFGGKVKRFTRELLLKGLVHVIASDTHVANGHREPMLLQGFNAAVAIIGLERADPMVRDNPRAILNNSPFQIRSPRQAKSRKFWWPFGRSEIS